MSITVLRNERDIQSIIISIEKWSDDMLVNFSLININIFIIVIKHLVINGMIVSILIIKNIFLIKEIITPQVIVLLN